MICSNGLYSLRRASSGISAKTSGPLLRMLLSRAQSQGLSPFSFLSSLLFSVLLYISSLLCPFSLLAYLLALCLSFPAHLLAYLCVYPICVLHRWYPGPTIMGHKMHWSEWLFTLFLLSSVIFIIVSICFFFFGCTSVALLFFYF